MGIDPRELQFLEQIASEGKRKYDKELGQWKARICQKFNHQKGDLFTKTKMAFDDNREAINGYLPSEKNYVIDSTSLHNNDISSAYVSSSKVRLCPSNLRVGALANT